MGRHKVISTHSTLTDNFVYYLVDYFISHNRTINLLNNTVVVEVGHIIPPLSSTVVECFSQLFLNRTFEYQGVQLIKNNKWTKLQEKQLHTRLRV